MPTALERYARLKAAQALHRAEALVPVRIPILGGQLHLEPLTLRRWGLLVATENALVMGQPVTFRDLANFVWIHHPEFGQFNRQPKSRVTALLHRWLHPRYPNLEAARRLWALHPRFRWLVGKDAPDYAARRRELVATLRDLITRAWDEMPVATHGREEGEPVPCAFGAYLNSLFPHWTPDTLADLPLTALAQHVRALVVDRKGANDLSLLTPEESAIWQDYLADPLGRKQAAPA